MLSSKTWPADDVTVCDIRPRDIRIWQINFSPFLGWQKRDDFKYERTDVTKRYFAYRFVSFSRNTSRARQYSLVESQRKLHLTGTGPYQTIESAAEDFHYLFSLGTGVQLLVFFCSSVPVGLFDTPGISRCRSQHVSVESSSLLHHSIYLWFICFTWWSIDELGNLHANCMFWAMIEAEGEVGRS